MNMPAVPLKSITFLPGIIAHFDVSREKSLHAIEQAMMEQEQVFLITQFEEENQDINFDSLYKVGVIADIKQVIEMPNNIVRVLIEAKTRAKLIELLENTTYFEVQIEPIPDDFTQGKEVSEAMNRSVKEVFARYFSLNPKVGKELLKEVNEESNLGKNMNQITNKLPIDYKEKQKVLEALDIESAYETLLKLLFSEIEITGIKNEFQAKVKEKIDKNQKEYILREQMKLIREELGEEDQKTQAERYFEELKKLKAEKEVKEKIKKEISRFASMNANASESNMLKVYIETLLEFPWSKKTKDNTSFQHAKDILDQQHYGLDKVKERMLEFLAVRNLTGKGESPIICLVGPPGTGKTSIARSVATALDKKFVRISLGGVRDEAQIRGHRRTYVGAMPGRIVAGLKDVGVNNPVILLDEVDKASSDYKGDISAALLEVLDSEQNRKFRDHYMEIPIDLSEALFITTANSLQTIPRPLLDRMEIVELSSYTENEKEHIAKRHLIQKQMKKNGLKENQLSISEHAISYMIHYYTKEAGVRNLERRLGEICRKAARQIYEKEKESIKITTNNLSKYLGKEKYQYDMKNEQDEIGVVRGLAWTSVGGDTLEIEVSVMPGKGNLKLTGQLGDVMKESAQAGISYIRSMSEQFSIENDFFQTHDIHMHIPEGAVPKDGPSAGITMATATLSAILKEPVLADLAMTGEITLRGRVLAIGGLKEKTLAAKAAGITKLCVPKKNEKDMLEISEEIRKGLEIHFVETMEDVLKIAFSNPIFLNKKNKSL